MANSHPPPSAKPFTAATTGLGQFSILLNTFSCPILAILAPPAASNSINSVISAPATNAFCPAPVSITLLISLFAYTSSKALLKSAITSLFKAFILSGLLIVMVAIPFSTLKSNVFNSILYFL